MQASKDMTPQERLLESGKDFQNQPRKICPQMKDAVHGSFCTLSMAYSAGAWAVSYSINKSGENVLLEKFHPNVEKLGWDGAFLSALNMTPAAFYSDFEKFLDLPIAEQVKSLPTY